MADERWRWVVGYEGLYMVSDQGRVMSVPLERESKGTKYQSPGRVLKDYDNGKGYRVLSLHKGGKQHQTTVHRVVAEAFIPNPENKPQINHKDGNKTNNSANNLEWVTSKENMTHASKVLKNMPLNRNFTEEQVLAIRSDKRSEREIADSYGVCQTVINAIRIGRTYREFGGSVGRAGRSRQRKFDAEDVREIRKSDKSITQLAKDYGVAFSTIKKIRQKTTYKEVI